MLEKLRGIVQKDKWKELGEVAVKIHPYDLSVFLEETRPKIRNKIMSKLPRKVLMVLLPELSERACAGFIRALPVPAAANLLSKMPPDETIDILQHLAARVRTKIIEQFSKGKRQEVESLLKYPSETAGGLMTTQFIALSDNTLVQSAISYIRKKAKEYPVYYIYVTSPEERLVGVLSLRQLILARPKEKLKEVMTREVVKASPRIDQERVAALMTDHNLIALPVVDKKNRILGVVTADDAMEVMEEEAREDIAIMSGITPPDSLVDVSATAMVKARLPWLMMGLGGGVLTAYIVGFFEPALSTHVVLAMFIPVLLYMSAAAGVQSETIVVRAMALEPKFRIERYLLREVKVAAVIAAVCGFIISAIAASIWGPPLLGLAIGTSMFSSMLFVTLLATFLPLLLKKLNIDPAIATGPFATILSDITTLVIYFGIASALIRFI